MKNVLLLLMNELRRRRGERVELTFRRWRTTPEVHMDVRT